jgi:hypothetical protein
VQERSGLRPPIQDRSALFCRLSEEEIAGIAGTSTRTVERDRRFARSRLVGEPNTVFLKGD